MTFGGVVNDTGRREIERLQARVSELEAERDALLGWQKIAEANMVSARIASERAAGYMAERDALRALLRRWQASDDVMLTELLALADDTARALGQPTEQDG